MMLNSTKSKFKQNKESQHIQQQNQKDATRGINLQRKLITTTVACASNYKEHIKTQGETIQPEMARQVGREIPSRFEKIEGRERGTQRQDEEQELHCPCHCRPQAELNRPVALPPLFPSLSLPLG